MNVLNLYCNFSILFLPYLSLCATAAFFSMTSQRQWYLCVAWDQWSARLMGPVRWFHYRKQNSTLWLLLLLAFEQTALIKTQWKVSQVVRLGCLTVFWNVENPERLHSFPVIHFINSLEIWKALLMAVKVENNNICFLVSHREKSFFLSLTKYCVPR